VVLIVPLTRADHIGHALPSASFGPGPFDLHPLVLVFVLSGSLMVSKTVHIPSPEAGSEGPSSGPAFSPVTGARLGARADRRRSNGPPIGANPRGVWAPIRSRGRVETPGEGPLRDFDEDEVGERCRAEEEEMRPRQRDEAERPR
jgi:hypothetical protein